MSKSNSTPATPKRRGRPPKQNKGNDIDSGATEDAISINDVGESENDKVPVNHPQKGRRGRPSNSPCLRKTSVSGNGGTENEQRPKRQRRPPKRLEDDVEISVSVEKETVSSDTEDESDLKTRKKKEHIDKPEADLDNSKSERKVSDISDNEIGAEIKTPKKRGRPKKSDVSLNSSRSGKKVSEKECDEELNHPRKRRRTQKSRDGQNSDFSDSEDDLEINLPKKRGRPKRSDVRQAQKSRDEQNSDFSDSEDEVEIILPKRRGRPKKSDVSLNNSRSDKESEEELNDPRKTRQAQKSGDGQNSDFSDSEDEVEIILPKKRGRPKKESASTPKSEKKRGRTPKGRLSDASKTSNGTKSKKNLENLTCAHCQETLLSLNQLKGHLMRKHNALWTADCPEGKTDGPALGVILRTLKKLTCLKCGKELRFVHYYRKHVEWCGREHEKFRCEECNGEIMLMWKREHELVHIREKRQEEERAELAARLKELKSTNEAMTTEGDENAEKTSLGRTKRSAAKKAQNIMQSINSGNDPNTGPMSSDSDDPDVQINSDAEDEDDDDDYDDDNDDDDIDTEINEGELEDNTELENKNIGPKPRKKRKKWSGGPFDLFQCFMLTFDKHLKYHKNQQDLGSTFVAWKPKRSEWILQNSSEMEDYLPKEKESVQFSVTKSENVPRNPQLQTIKRFESAVVEGSLNFFVGGPIWAMAWCPVPYNQHMNQYLAVSCYKEMDSVYPTSTPHSENGSIQIWNLGKLDYNLESLKKPKLEFIVAHSYGVIRGLEWCPHNCCESGVSGDEEHLPRIGLLAAACSDGSVVIFSIPMPESLLNNKGGTETLFIYKPRPVVILLPWHPSKSDKTTPCLCISWQPQHKHQYLLAGYGDGSVRIWDLHTQSPLLQLGTNPITLLPCRSIKVSLNSVMSCYWSPHVPKYFATGNRDRIFHLWHMDHLDIPRHKVNAMMTNAIQWPHHVLACWHSLDDSFTIHDSFIRAELYDVLIYDDDQTLSEPMANIPNCIWGFSCSNWLMNCLGANSDGQVIGTVVPKFRKDVVKKPHRRKIVLYDTILKERPNSGKQSNTVCHEEIESEMDSSGLIKPAESSQSGDLENDNVQSKNCDLPLSTTEIEPEGQNEDEKGKNKKKTAKKTNKESLNGNDTETKSVFTTYQSSANHYYLQFRDICINSRIYQLPKRSDLACQFMLPALHRVQFNPNLHSCSWIATGGQTGIVRLHNIIKIVHRTSQKQLQNAYQQYK